MAKSEQPESVSPLNEERYAAWEIRILNDGQPALDLATIRAAHEFWEFQAEDDVDVDAWFHAHLTKALRAAPPLVPPPARLTFQQTTCPKCSHRFSVEVLGLHRKLLGEPSVAPSTTLLPNCPRCGREGHSGICKDNCLCTYFPEQPTLSPQELAPLLLESDFESCTTCALEAIDMATFICSIPGLAVVRKKGE